MTPYPFFAVPTLSHSVCIEFFRSWGLTTELLRSLGVKHTIDTFGGDMYIAKARNRLAYRFLVDFPDATELFFLDDDIGWEAEAVVRFLQSCEDIVAGIYPQRQDKVNFPVMWDKAPDGSMFEAGGLLRALTVPTGFLRIRRSVLERMAAASQTYTEELAGGEVITVHEIFRMGASGGKWWGEDIEFCNRWVQEFGGEIWVDPDITFTHSGRKQWSGRLADQKRALTREAAE